MKRDHLMRSVKPQRASSFKLMRRLTLYRWLQVAVLLAMQLHYMFTGMQEILTLLLWLMPFALVSNNVLWHLCQHHLRVNQAEQAQMLAVMNEQAALIRKLRTQRHDFVNHLQVVYLMLQMKQYEKMAAYVEQMYSDIRSVNSHLKTRSAALNALLAAKESMAKERGVLFSVRITADLSAVGVDDWTLCRILANLLDNAMDAAQEADHPLVSFSAETGRGALCLEVTNNGPHIDEAMRSQLLEAGFTTKLQGTGMGLYIVREAVSSCHGRLYLSSDAEKTTFTVVVPLNGESDAWEPEAGDMAMIG